MLSWKTLLKKHERLLILLAASAGLSALLLSFEFNGLESALYDLRVSQGSQAQPDSNIVLITVDDKTTQALDDFAPLTLDYHAQFLEKLEHYKPKGVGYLVDMSVVNQAGAELFQSPWAKRFVDAAERLRQNGTPFVLGTNFDVTGEVVPPYPLSSLPHSLAVIHKDGNVFGEDKITRRALVQLNGKDVFHSDLAEAAKLSRSGDLPPGTFTVREIDTKYFFFRYHGDTSAKIQSNGNQPEILGGYQRFSFNDILNGTVPEAVLRDKLVLVGTLSKDNSSDFAFTPYSKEPFSNPKIVVHANILDSMIHHQGVLRLPRWVNAAVTFSGSFFVLWWVLNSTPLNGVFAALTLILSFVVTGQLLFQVSGIWLRESQPLVAIFLGYYLAVPYRLILEYKTRWEYQRKNQLLTQVEELKTNFLSLVTHDLKTPVARIQGLAEVLLRKADERLIDRDKETLHHIIQSTDDLNRFISSILELSKVESQNLQIKLESKDINQIIERSIESFKASARAKQIKIVENLEPLFPVKIDATLISKVINNLIDNAIKYSPAHSSVTISSTEKDGWIEVAIQDQGVGLSEEELQNLFTRFYRAKNDATARTSGTGLGLYLTRFFVRAHHGRVEVESEKGKGSTFKIILPIEIQEQKQEALSSKPAGLTVRLASLLGAKRTESVKAELK